MKRVVVNAMVSDKYIRVRIVLESSFGEMKRVGEYTKGN